MRPVSEEEADLQRQHKQLSKTHLMQIIIIYILYFSVQNGVGRDFLCQICGKSYLSSPALYLHMKTKHVQALGNQAEVKRGRGRPKRIDG